MRGVSVHDPATQQRKKTMARRAAAGTFHSLTTGGGLAWTFVTALCPAFRQTYLTKTRRRAADDVTAGVPCTRTHSTGWWREQHRHITKIQYLTILPCCLNGACAKTRRWWSFGRSLHIAMLADLSGPRTTLFDCLPQHRATHEPCLQHFSRLFPWFSSSPDGVALFLENAHISDWSFVPTTTPRVNACWA